MFLKCNCIVFCCIFTSVITTKGNNMTTSTLNHFAQLATEKLNDLKGELAYTQQVLSEQGLEAWEKKEYLQLEESYIEQIKDQEAHIEMMKAEGLW